MLLMEKRKREERCTYSANNMAYLPHLRHPFSCSNEISFEYTTPSLYGTILPQPISFMNRRHILTLMLTATFRFSGVVLAQQSPPSELKSPDHRYTVKVLNSALPGSDPDDGFFTIAVYTGQHCLSKFPTEGYLENAFWSADGKYVAVNNRRANSGDYLWVFRQSDGYAVKKPVDADPHKANAYEEFERKLIKPVTAVDASLTFDTLRKDFTFSTEWIKNDELMVENDVQFNNLEKQVIQVLETYKVDGSKLQLVNRVIERRTRGIDEF